MAEKTTAPDATGHEDFIKWKLFIPIVLALGGAIAGAYAFSYTSSTSVATSASAALSSHTGDSERHLTVKSMTALDDRYMTRREMEQLRDTINETRGDMKELLKRLGTGE